MSSIQDFRARRLAQLLREKLHDATDMQLGLFLEGYAFGHVAGVVISLMTPEQRAGFFVEMRQQYPDAFAPAPPER